MFIGEFNYKLDKKGRVNIPSEYRQELGESFYITKGLDGCLFVFTDKEWSTFVQKLKTLPLTNKNAREFVRFFYSGAVNKSLDKQGRINLPKNLINHAQLDKTTYIIGVGTRIEIWSEENWKKYNDVENIDYNDLAERMSELGI